MSKKFSVNGRDVWVNEADFDYLKEILKDVKNIELDDLVDWENQVNYNETECIQKANEYFRSNDYVQAHEKLWAAASYSVKKYFLRMGIKLASHNAKKHVVKVMIDEARKLRLMFGDVDFVHSKLEIGWRTAERCHASFNELTSTSPEEWKEKYADVENFVKVLNDLDSNDVFKDGLLTSLLNPPAPLTCEKYARDLKEMFGDQKYKISRKIF